MDIGAQVAAAQDGLVRDGGPEVAKRQSLVPPDYRSPGRPAGEAEKASDQDSVAVVGLGSGLRRCAATGSGWFLDRGRIRYCHLAPVAAREPVVCRSERPLAEHEAPVNLLGKGR